MANLINLIFPIDKKNNKRILLINDKTKEEEDFFLPDAIISITHNMSSEVSENPIEDGSKVTDNIIKNNRELTIEGVVAAQPLEVSKSLVNAGVTALAGFLPPFVQGTVAGLLRLNQSSNRLEDGYKVLEKLHEDKIRFTMITGFKRYDNMVITSLTIPETQIKELRFTMTIKQIKIATTIFVKIPETQLKEDVKTTATSKVDEGKKTTVTPDAETEKQGSSFLLKLAQSTGVVQ